MADQSLQRLNRLTNDDENGNNIKYTKNQSQLSDDGDYNVSEERYGGVGVADDDDGDGMEVQLRTTTEYNTEEINMNSPDSPKKIITDSAHATHESNNDNDDANNDDDADDDNDDPYGHADVHTDADNNSIYDGCDDDPDTDDEELNENIDGDSDDGDGARSKFGIREHRESRMTARRSTLWDSVSDEVHFSREKQ